MIKKIHYCWFGSEKPDIVKRNVEHWSRLNPDFEICEWNESNIDMYDSEYVRKAMEKGKWAFVSDFVRLHVLQQQGGVYLDVDVELIKPFSSIEMDKLILGYMYDCALGTAVMYSPPDHPYIRNILQSYQFLNSERVIVNNTIFTAYFINNVPGFMLNGKEWENELCHIYPKEFFEQPAFIKSNGMSIHHCCGSWKASFNKRFGFEGNAGLFAHMLKWASRKRRTWLAARNNEFTACHRDALRGVHSEFDVSGIYTVENPYNN